MSGEDDIQFDSCFLELKGDTKIDSAFFQPWVCCAGKYNLQVQLNKQPLAEESDIYFGIKVKMTRAKAMLV